MAIRTGYKGWSTLEEYDTYHGTATGVTKPNVPGDPDYVAPVYDPAACPLQEQALLFTTDEGSYPTEMAIWLNQFDGAPPASIDLVVRKGGATIKEITVPVGGLAPEPFDVEENGVSVYVRTPVGGRDGILQLSMDGIAGGDWGINSIFPAIFPELTKLNVSGQSQLTSIDWSQNVKLDRLEVYRNGLTGHMDTSMLTLLVSLEFFGNGFTTISPMSNHPDLVYFNSVENALTSVLDFSSCPDIETIRTSRNDIPSINISGTTKLKTLDVSRNLSLAQSFDLTSNPDMEEFAAEGCPLTDVTFNANTRIKVFVVSTNDIPESSMVAGIASNKSTLEVLVAQSMPQLVDIIDLDDATNLFKVWLSDNDNLLGVSWDNCTLLKDVSVAGMSSLSHAIDLTGNPANGFLWLTGADMSASNLDDILNYISGLDIPPVQEHEVGAGAIIYGDWETSTGTIYPTSSSLAAYNDLVSRGYTIIGPVPGI